MGPRLWSILIGLLGLIIYLQAANTLSYRPLPTIAPVRDFDANRDAAVLRKALKGFGTDIDVLVKMMSTRSNFQRIHMAMAYKANYHRDLTEHVKSDTNRKFERMMVALLTPAAEYDAQCIRESVKGFGTDLDTLFEILFTRTPKQLRSLRATYAKKYKRDMISDIKGDTTGKVEDILVAIAQADRDETDRTDPTAAADAAIRMKGGGIGKLFGSHIPYMIQILTKWNFNQLHLFFDQYQRVNKKTIEEDISYYGGGETKRALLALVKCIRNPAVYFAERIHHAITGMGTKDKDLIRIFATRTEVDMGNIKNEYYTKYNTPMEKAIRKDVSGKFQKILVALIRGNLQPLTGNESNDIEE